MSSPSLCQAFVLSFPTWKFAPSPKVYFWLTDEKMTYFMIHFSRFMITWETVDWKLAEGERRLQHSNWPFISFSSSFYSRVQVGHLVLLLATGKLSALSAFLWWPIDILDWTSPSSYFASPSRKEICLVVSSSHKPNKVHFESNLAVQSGLKFWFHPL